MSFEIYSDNLIYQSKITASSENMQFPLANLIDPRRSKVFRSTSHEDDLIFDFNETSEVDAFMAVDDKRSGFGVNSIDLNFNATSNFDGITNTVSIPLSPKLGIGFLEFPKVEFRFCKMSLKSSLDYCELSKIFIGKKLELERSINFGWSIKDNDLSIKTSNRYGQLFVDKIRTQKVISCRLALLDKNQLDKVFSWLDTYSEIRPFFVRIGCNNMVNDNRRFSGMVYLSDSPTIVNSSFGRYDLSFTLNEAM
jgi:hypothetical protein